MSADSRSCLSDEGGHRSFGDDLYTGDGTERGHLRLLLDLDTVESLFERMHHDMNKIELTLREANNTEVRLHR
jgi:hypothetical protein